MIEELQKEIFFLKNDNRKYRSPGRDRYDTCLRELDMLKTNLDDQ